MGSWHITQELLWWLYTAFGILGKEEEWLRGKEDYRGMNYVGIELGWYCKVMRFMMNYYFKLCCFHYVIIPGREELSQPLWAFSLTFSDSCSSILKPHGRDQSRWLTSPRQGIGTKIKTLLTLCEYEASQGPGRRWYFINCLLILHQIFLYPWLEALGDNAFLNVLFFI